MELGKFQKVECFEARLPVYLRLAKCMPTTASDSLVASSILAVTSGRSCSTKMLGYEPNLPLVTRSFLATESAA